MRKAIIILLMLLCLSALGINAKAQTVDSYGNLLTTGSFDSLDVCTYQESYMRYEKAGVFDLDEPRYYVLNNASNNITFEIECNVNQGANFTCTLRDGSIVTGWVYLDGHFLNYDVYMSLDGVTIKKNFIDVFAAHYGFHLALVNNSGTGQYGLGLYAMPSDCGMIVKPLSSRFNGITSVYMVPNGAYYNKYYFVFAAPYQVTFYEGYKFHSTLTGYDLNTNTSMDVNPLDQITKSVNDAWTGFNTLYDSFYKAFAILLIFVFFIIQPTVFMLCILLLQTGYTAFNVLTARDLRAAISKQIRFERAFFMSLFTLFELIVRFVYWSFNMLVKVYSLLVEIFNVAAGTVIKIIDAIIPF